MIWASIAAAFKLHLALTLNSFTRGNITTNKFSTVWFLKRNAIEEKKMEVRGWMRGEKKGGN